jgi:hypothetical protein
VISIGPRKKSMVAIQFRVPDRLVRGLREAMEYERIAVIEG